jgi:hypothetical protein
MLKGFSDAPHETVFGYLLFIVFSDDLRNTVNYSLYPRVQFADDIRIFHAIKSPTDCNDLESDFDYIGVSCTELVKPELYLSHEKLTFF